MKKTLILLLLSIFTFRPLVVVGQEQKLVTIPEFFESVKQQMQTQYFQMSIDSLKNDYFKLLKLQDSSFVQLKKSTEILKLMDKSIDWFNVNITTIPRYLRVDSINKIIVLADKQTNFANHAIKAQDNGTQESNTFFRNLTRNLEKFVDASKENLTVLSDYNFYYEVNNSISDLYNDNIEILNKNINQLNEIDKSLAKSFANYNKSIRAK